MHGALVSLGVRRFWRLAVLAGCCAVGTLAIAVEPEQGSWTQWRGPDRDGISHESGLLPEWPKRGPEMVWEVDTVGVGYSSMAVADGRIVTQGDIKGVEHAICLSVKDGSVIWAVQPAPVAAALAEQLSREFASADANGNGTVDEAEALRKFGWDFNKFDDTVVGAGPSVAEKRAVALVSQLDKDGDGKLNHLEAGRVMEQVFTGIDRPDPQADKAALAATRAAGFLKDLDTNKDGKLDRKELNPSPISRDARRIDQAPAGEKSGDDLLTEEEIRAHLEKFAPGSDGLLTADELRDYFARTYPGQDGLLSQDEMRGYYGGYRNGQGDGPRGTPTIDGSRVYVEGGNGDLTCFDITNGKTIWHLNLRTDLNGGRPGWGYCESPLVYNDWLIVTPGGKDGTIAALDKNTGEVLWRSEDNQAAHYSSAIIAEIAGVKQIVQFARNSCFGISLDGKTLWSYSAANNGTANVATPIIYNDHVFASSSYGTGGGLARITANGQGQQAEEVYFEKKMANHHGGLVKVDDYLYGFGSGGLICMHYLTGEIAWTARSVSKGSILYADGRLYCLGERYEVDLVEPNPNEYRSHGQFKIANLGRPSWAHPVVAGGRLYIRNQTSLASYDIANKP